MSITTLLFESPSPAETQQLGRRLGEAIRHFLIAHPAADEATMTLALSGEMGTGKTTFTQGVAAGIGVTAQVTSPTFTLVNEYTVTPITLIHMDSYRLNSNIDQNETAASDLDLDVVSLDAASFGIEEFFEIPRSLVIIEWANRLRALLPVDHLSLHFSYGLADCEVDGGDRPDMLEEVIDQDEYRTIELQAHGLQSGKLLEVLKP